MGRLSKHRRVKSIDPHRKGVERHASTSNSIDSQQPQKDPPRRTLKDPSRHLAPESNERIPKKFKEFMRAKEMAKRQIQRNKQMQKQKQNANRNNKSNKRRPQPSSNEPEVDPEGGKMQTKRGTHIRGAIPEKRKRERESGADSVQEPKEKRVKKEDYKIRPGETLREYKKRTGAAGESIQARADSSGLLTRDTLRAMRKEEQGESNKTQKRREFLNQKKNKKKGVEAKPVHYSSSDESEDEDDGRDRLHEWEDVKFGDFAKAPPKFTFQPKVKEGFTFHKETESKVKGGSQASYAAYFNKNVAQVYVRNLTRRACYFETHFQNDRRSKSRNKT